MCECKLFYFGAFVVCNVVLVTSFNIDKSNYAIYGKDTPSMFGFTVALHVDRGNRPWVLVGAPEAQSRYQNEREVFRGGAVYKCQPLQDDRCEEIEFNPKHNKRMGNAMIDDQSKQWFGATLSTSGKTDGPVVACAPRYIWFTKDLNRRDPVGTCFVANGGLDSYEEYSPCRTMNWGYHRQGSCQAGFSAAINKEGDRLYVGAPGSYYWQGQMYSIDAHATFNYTPSFFGYLGYGAKGTVFQQKLEDRPAVISTREGAPPDDDSYIGYSLVVGQFREYDPNEGIAVGMPRGNRLRGKVLLFTWDLKNYKNITVSKQIGSYFGYSITAADVNGDKRLDIIVGAPMHTKPNNEMKYDVGRVYIFYQTDNEATSFNTSQHIDGKNSKGRFGHSVSTLGDINRDGFDDFAVGAPYDGPEGRGAVYIYYGSKDGIRDSYGQVLYAEDIHSHSPVKTFGFSITGGVDLDGNDYPDMAVGAYLSDTAIFFRSRPTVVVDAYVNFLTPRKQIDITKRNCSIDNRQDNTNLCTAINFCIKYTGKGIPDQMYMTLQYVLDSKKQNRPRMFFKERNTNRFNRTILLYKHQEQCETKEVYLSNDIRDKLTALEAQVNYALMDYSGVDRVRNPQSQLRPVLDLNSPPSKDDTIFIQKDCGEDDICIPDLHLNVTSDVRMHYLGSEIDLGFDIVVSNFGEDAFETKFEMRYPKGIEFKKPEIGADMSGILCDPPFNNTITCDIGNPLPRRKIAKFRLLFQPPTAPTAGLVAPRYDFDVYVNSTNPEEKSTRADNHRHIVVDIGVEASLELRGDSYPSTVYFNESQYMSKDIVFESDIGPQVSHVYILRNGGPSVIEQAELYILWPSKTLTGEDLLYLLAPPKTEGNVKCELPQEYGGTQQRLQYNYNHYRVEKTVEDIWKKFNIDTSSVAEEKATSAAAQNTEVGKGIASGVGVVSVNTNETRYENTYTKGSVTKTTSSSKGKMFVDEYGNTRTVIEANMSPSQTTHFGGSQGGSRQYYNENQRKIVAGQQTPVQVGGQGGTHYREEAYEVGGGPREGGLHRQDGGQFATEHKFRQDNLQQVTGDRSQGTYYEQHGAAGGAQGQYGQGTYHEQHGSAGGAQGQYGQGSYHEQHGAAGGAQGQYGQGTYNEQHGAAGGAQGQYGQGTYNEQHGVAGGAQGQYGQGSYHEQHSAAGGSQGQYGQRQFSVYNDTYGQRHNQDADGGRRIYYNEQRGSPAGGEVIYSKTYTIESSTSIPIDVTQLQSNRQPLDEVAGGQGYRVQLIGMDNTASEISIAGANRGVYDHSGRPITSYEERYNDSRIQGGSSGGSYSHGSRTYSQGGEGYSQSGGTHRQGGGSYSQGGGSYSQSGGGYSQSGGSYGQGGGAHVGGSATGFRETYGQQGGSGSTQWHREGSYSQSGRIEPTILHNSIESDNVPTDRPSANQRRRGRRMAPDFLDEIQQEMQYSQKCSSTQCSLIKCTVGTVRKDGEVIILLRSRLNVRAVSNITATKSIKLSSMMIGKITKLPFIGEPTEKIIRKHEVFTEVPAKEQELVPEVAPLWLYVISAVAGVVMLLLLTWLLCKCGFFKRNRPSSAPERQPLNRNGYHSGDEAL